MKKLIISIIILIVVLSITYYFSPTDAENLSRIAVNAADKARSIQKPKIMLAKSTLTTVPGTVKPIENLLRKTALVCSHHLTNAYGVVSNYNAENMDYSTTAETGNNPLKNLLFTVHKHEKPLPFNDHWAKVNTIKGMHNAAREDGKLDYVLKISKQMHLPPSVATVPIVESNYRNTTVSSKGAVGAWQLMPETARDYGLKLKERSKLAASTKAALRLLKDLHEKFNNWELAYAAYNAGGARVEKAIQKNPHALSIEELDLPRETKEYVNRLRKINALIKKFAHVKSNISQLIVDFEY